jgi:hypothetical protein
MGDMFRPLSDDEKRQALIDGCLGAKAEAKRRADDIRAITQTAQNVFWSLVKTPTWEVVQAPLPTGASPQIEGWSVTPKVTRRDVSG